MARVEDILTRARIILGDQSKDRWTDSSLINRLNEGQYDIASETEIFKAVAVIQLIQGQYLYNLPADAIRAHELLLSQEPVEVIESYKMSKRFGSDWRLHTAESVQSIKAFVTDQQDVHTIRMYPRPFIADLYDDYTFDPNAFGVVDTITEYTVSDTFGLTGSIFDTELIDEPIDKFGVIVGVTEGEYVTAEYIRRPIKVASILDDPELPEVFDTALVKYIAGSALRDDTVSQNRSAGNEELTIYQTLLREIQGVAKTGSMTISSNSTTEYRGMGQ